jgi:hypothetical protein
MYVAAACSIALALHLQPGSHVVAHSTYDDRVQWVLPPDKLASFARSGVVINEDKLTSIVAVATVASPLREMTTLIGNVDTTITDVPRHRTQHLNSAISATVTPRDDPLPARLLDLEESGMVELPVTRLCVGQSWRTRIPVATTLGSGIASIVHTVVSATGALVEIEVKGAGTITGAEYNLPHLLPGSFSISGKAWFDVASGVVSQESYVVRNRLIRTVRDKTIGFIENETVDVSTHVGKPRALTPDPHTTP